MQLAILWVGLLSKLLGRPASVAFLVVVMLACFLTTLLLDSCSLLDAGVVALELDSCVGREVQNVFHGFAKEFVSKCTQQSCFKEGRLTEFL